MTKATNQTPSEAPKPAPVPRKVSGPDLTEGGRKTPYLFPQWMFYERQSRTDQFDYVSERLVELADEGSLSVTDLHNQPMPLPTIAGMIILGLEFAEASNEMVSASYVPPSLQDYEVRILSRERHIKRVFGEGKDSETKTETRKESISWKIGREPAGFHSVDRGGKGARCRLFRDAYMKFSEDVFDATFPLPTAWNILHQNGAHCVSAKRKDKQERLWKYAEVMPETAPSQKSASPFDGDTQNEPHLQRGMS